MAMYGHWHPLKLTIFLSFCMTIHSNIEIPHSSSNLWFLLPFALFLFIVDAVEEPYYRILSHIHQVCLCVRAHSLLYKLLWNEGNVSILLWPTLGILLRGGLFQAISFQPPSNTWQSLGLIWCYLSVSLSSNGRHFRQYIFFFYHLALISWFIDFTWKKEHIHIIIRYKESIYIYQPWMMN